MKCDHRNLIQGQLCGRCNTEVGMKPKRKRKQRSILQDLIQWVKEMIRG